MTVANRLFRKSGVSEERSGALIRGMSLEALCALRPQNMHPVDRAQVVTALRVREDKARAALARRSKRQRFQWERAQDEQVTAGVIDALSATRHIFEDFEAGYGGGR